MSRVGIALGIAVWASASPSIRNAPSLSELDDLGSAATMEA